MLSPLWWQCRHAFSHTSGHKGAECHPAIDCLNHLAPVVTIRPFEWDRIVGLQEAGWTYRQLLHTYRWCHCFQQWSPTPIDQVLAGRIVHTPVKIDALCQQRWPHTAKKSRHIPVLYLLCHQGPLAESGFFWF